MWVQTVGTSKEKTIKLRVSEKWLAMLDDNRGDMSRSEYIREAVKEFTGDSLESNVHEEPVEDSPIDTQDLPAPKVGFNPIPKSEQFKGVNKKGKMT